MTATAPAKLRFPNLSRELIANWNAPDAHVFRTWLIPLTIGNTEIWEDGKPVYIAVSACKCGTVWDFMHANRQPDGPCPARTAR